MKETSSNTYQRAILIDFDDTILRTTGYKDISYAFWRKHSS